MNDGYGDQMNTNLSSIAQDLNGLPFKAWLQHY